ncbi:MAG: cell division protein SepF, partial [Actinobacteria bacterium]|nr:cell division protein SepF [Actinomycetota bacterium]
LGQDPYYDYPDPELDHVDDDLDDDMVDAAPPTHASSRARPAAQRRTGASTPTVRPVSSGGVTPETDDGDGGVRVIAHTPGSGEPEAGRGVVRPLPIASRPHVVMPRNFNDVQEVADTFKRSQPVIVNLQSVDRDLSRRLIDFCSGLCYGLEGNMERVTDHVFLLTPSGAQVSDDDRRRIREGGLADDAR